MSQAAPRYDFASDNTAGMAPEALAAVVAANDGFSQAYGRDPVTHRAADLLRELLDADAEVFFVSSGTAANGLALGGLCRSYEAVLAFEGAHIRTDEAGAPSYFGHGLKMIGLPGESGKIDPAGLEAALAVPDASHRQSPAALSITNATEYGAVYSVGEISALTGPARASGVRVHLDGARLANAVAAGFDPRAIKALGINVLVIGGTKAGASATEAVVLFDRSLSRRFDAWLKQSGHMPSKARYLAAPWVGLLAAGAWVERARHANAMARRLADGVAFPLVHPVETNAVFMRIPGEVQARIRALGWVIYPFADGSVRAMCSWATTEALVDEFLSDMGRVA